MQSPDNSLTTYLNLTTHLKPSGLGKGLLMARQGHGSPNPVQIKAASEATSVIAAEVNGFVGSNVCELTGLPLTAHFLGGCPIGDSPETGVIDPYHRLYGHHGISVVDGSLRSPPTSGSTRLSRSPGRCTTARSAAAPKRPPLWRASSKRSMWKRPLGGRSLPTAAPIPGPSRTASRASYRPRRYGCTATFIPRTSSSRTERCHRRLRCHVRRRPGLGPRRRTGAATHGHRRARGPATMKSFFLILMGRNGERSLPGGKSDWGPAGRAPLDRVLKSV